MGKDEKGKHKAFLRSTSGTNSEGYHMVNIPPHIWKEIGWKINDNLIIETTMTFGHGEEIIVIKKES